MNISDNPRNGRKHIYKDKDGKILSALTWLMHGGRLKLDDDFDLEMCDDGKLIYVHRFVLEDKKLKEYSGYDADISMNEFIDLVQKMPDEDITNIRFNLTLIKSL